MFTGLDLVSFTLGLKVERFSYFIMSFWFVLPFFLYTFVVISSFDTWRSFTECIGIMFLQCMTLNMLLEPTTFLLVVYLKLSPGNALDSGFAGQFLLARHIWILTKLEISWRSRPQTTVVIHITWLSKTATISVRIYATSWLENGYQNGWIVWQG